MAKKEYKKQHGDGVLANPLNYAPKYNPYDKDAEENRTLGTKGYIPFLFWWPLVRKPESRFGRKCANQGLILTLLTIIDAVIVFVLSFFWTGKIGEYYCWEILAMAFAICIIGFTVNGLLSTSESQFIRVPIFGKITLISEVKKKK
jgi:hypothetical protein